MRIHLGPVQYVIFVFRSAHKAAAALGIPHQVMTGLRRLEPGLPGGILPEHLKAKILQVAGDKDLDITEDDLDCGRMVKFTEKSFQKWKPRLELSAYLGPLEP